MKYLIPQFIQEQFTSGKEYGTIEAYTMFVDLSGFTPLTETLMREGSRGAEQLSMILNEIFEPLVRLVYHRGGFIPYFAGDAFTAIFPVGSAPVSAREIVMGALQARHLFNERESRFGDFTIGLKIGLSYGEVQWGIVGNNRKAFYFRGTPIDQCAECQIRAANLDIIIDGTLQELLEDSAFGLEEIDHYFFRIVGQRLLDQTDYPPVHLPPLSEETALHFLPEAVIKYNQEGEFRTVISVFISFRDIDGHDLLNQFASVVINQMDNFAGYFKEMDFGDKGSVMVGFFGAPVSFENNVDRALEFISAVREELRALSLPTQSFRAGITLGTAYTGIVGGAERCQYAAVGNRVNLAARLMTFADWGEVLVDGEIKKNRHFKFLHKGDIKYKGIKGPVPTFKLIGKDFESRQAYVGPMVERRSELDALLNFARPLFDNKAAGVAFLFGEAGIGKSRLSFELRNILVEDGRVHWIVCQADQILRKPFNAFLYFLRDYFEQSVEDAAGDNRNYFESRFRELENKLLALATPESRRILDELLRTRTVLAALLGIVYPDSLWDQLDARGRYQNTLAAILNLIWAESLLQPTVIELEDGHWLDDNSRELLQELVRLMGRYPLMLLITSRYRDDGSKPLLIEPEIFQLYHLPLLEIDLGLLQPETVRQFAELRLGAPISEEFFDLLLRSTNSNPFYVEQVLEYFSESNLLQKDQQKWTIRDQNVQLSNSINAILTARIDRLSTLVKETVKAAAVIGREFEVPILSEVMKAQEEFSHGNEQGNTLLREQIKTAEKGQIWLAMNELRYIFRHSLLREAVYSMQLRTRLRQLHHLIAEAIERLYGDNIEERYVDLAFHYEQAGVFDKTCEYLRKSADHARRNYQNQQALDYYERLLKKLGREKDTVDEIRTYLKKGKVLELIGHWEECGKAYEVALQMAKKSRDVLLLGQANNNMGRLLMLRGDYPRAMGYLQTAIGLFESVDDKLGISRGYGDLGNLYFRQGQYEEAKSYFEQSISLGYAESGTAGSAQIVANLGLTHMNQGNFEEGIRVQQQQLRVCQRMNDKQGMATLHTNIGIVFFEKGDYDAALESYRKGLSLSEELGNKLLTSIAIGCIGSVYERKGDYEKAMEHFQHDLDLCEELGDKQGIAIALGLIGELLSIKGEFFKAIDYLQKNLMICEELGYKKGIAKAVNTLGDVFFFLKQYDRSLHFYNRAIEITRGINNGLVLGFSLVEKGAVLIELNRKEELEQVREEALRIAAQLGNPDLLLEAQLLTARTESLNGRPEEAKKRLNELLNTPLRKEQQAEVFFECFLLDPANQQARQQALTLYRELFQSTPRYIYQHRLEQLQPI